MLIVDVPVTHHTLRRLLGEWRTKVQMSYHPETRNLQVLARPVGERWVLRATAYNALRWARRFAVPLHVS